LKTYLALLKPTEPYFFGNEKTFLYPGSEAGGTPNRYFIRSEAVPSQSTVLGALRYLFLPVKKSDWNYSDAEKKQNEEAVGTSGFEPETEHTYGKISKISPVFLKNEASILVPTPLDHMVGNKTYKPFSQYKTVETSDGTQYYTEEYDTKEGIASGYLQLSDGAIVEENQIFKRVVRTGINRTAENKGFFKKEYAMLLEGYSFGVYVELEDDLVPADGIVFLGQGKSAFAISFREEANCVAEDIKKYLQKDVAYCWGDLFVSASVYQECYFSVTKTKTYRAYSKWNNRVTKASTLYKPVAAGSIFIPKDKEAFKKLAESTNASRIGYNVWIMN